MTKASEAAEVDNLVSALYSGVVVMPSDTVQRTTILVTPMVYAALQERIEADTAKAKRMEGAENG